MKPITWDWRQPVVYRLRNYRLQQIGLESARERLRWLRAAAVGTGGGRMDAVPVSGSPSTSSREERLIANISEREELAHLIAIVKEDLHMVERGLEVLDERERAAIELFYIDRPRDYMDRICETLGCERSEAYRIKDGALQKLTVAMYGRLL